MLQRRSVVYSWMACHQIGAHTEIHVAFTAAAHATFLTNTKRTRETGDHLAHAGLCFLIYLPSYFNLYLCLIEQN